MDTKHFLSVSQSIEKNNHPQGEALHTIEPQDAKQESPVLQLPSDFLKTPDTSYQPAYWAVPLGSQDVALFQADSSAIGKRSLVLTAFTALLYRYTQQQTITLQVNLPTDGEDHYSTEIRTQVSGELKARELVRYISLALKGTQAKLDSLTQPLLNEPLQPTNGPITATFIDRVQNQEDWIQAHQSYLAEASQDLDLHLVVLQQDENLSIVLNYNANLFKLDTIQRLAGHLQVLVAAMSDGVDRSIAQLPLLTTAEEDQILREWHSGSATFPAVPIFHAIEVHATQQPNAIAATFGQQHVTYHELNQRANQMAHYLISVGIKAEVRVAVCIQPSLDILVALLGIFKAGGVYVPLDPTHPVERLSVILEDTQPQVLLTQSQFLPLLPAKAEQALCLDTDWETVESFSLDNPNTALSLEQTAYIIYTSGTTGKPKGVMASHANLVNYVLLAQERFGFNKTDVMPAIARFTFSITMFELLSPLVAGGKLMILEREHVLDFKRMAQTLEELTVIHTSPSLMQKLLAYIQANNLDLQKFHKLRHVSVGGDMASAEVLETMRTMFQTAEVFVIYGCSEVSCMGCAYPVPSAHPVTKSRVGTPFRNVAVRLYDPHQNLVPIGIPGEVYIAGSGVTKGYLHREELTQEKFVTIDEQRFYRTGDLGRFDTEGNLEILGRSDFQIKLRGMRIELGEIESALRRAPNVREGIVMARELGNSEKSLVAYIVLEQPQNSQIEEIRNFLKQKLPDYMMPAVFVVLEAMPVNLNQKVDRNALPLPTPENIAGFKPFISARNEWEQKLTQIWETVLGVTQIGIQDNFFELGGHSLLAVSLMTQIEQVFHQTLPLSLLLTAPTIEQLAALLNPSTQAAPRNSLILLREGETKPPIFFIHDGEGETLLYRTLANYLKPGHPVYGMQPYSSAEHPILHTRVSEMAAYYIEQVRSVQPEGPYFLGGLCVGGFLAFEMARQLESQGQTVGMVALIDTADVEAQPRTGLITNQRLSSFSKSLSQFQQVSIQRKLFSFLQQASQKIYNVTTYETRTRLNKAKNQAKIRLFRHYLDQKEAIPSCLQNISVRIILKFAEREYIPQDPYSGELVLFRATQGTNSTEMTLPDGTFIDDTPYTEIYTDPLLGWEERTTQGLVTYDIPGGHSSMLQEPNVQVMAEKMQAYIDQAIARTKSTELLEASQEPSYSKKILVA